MSVVRLSLWEGKFFQKYSWKGMTRKTLTDGPPLRINTHLSNFCSDHSNFWCKAHSALVQAILLWCWGWALCNTGNDHLKQFLSVSCSVVCTYNLCFSDWALSKLADDKIPCPGKDSDKGYYWEPSVSTSHIGSEILMATDRTVVSNSYLYVFISRDGTALSSW